MTAEKKRERANRVRELLAATFGRTCAHCGREIDGKKALHYHHTDPSAKSFAIGEVMYNSPAKLIAEARKCIILCASCHARHHNRLRAEAKAAAK